MLSARLGPKVPERISRPAFAVVLLTFSLFFVLRQLS
jgi:hypothetical protein